MKKRMLLALALGAVFTFAAVGCGTGSGGSDGSENGSPTTSESGTLNNGGSVNGGNQNSPSQKENHKDLNKYLSVATGNKELMACMNMELTTNNSGVDIYLGSETVETITINGDNVYTLTVKGYGGGCLQANNGGQLTFKNLTVKNTVDDASDVMFGKRKGYASFGGKVRFENCKFDGAIQIQDDAQAEFVNCTFESKQEDMYAVWFTDGSATFTGCSFSGYRAIKLYEGSDNFDRTEVQSQYDVVSLTIENCEFINIVKKPGLAIDFMDAGASSITIKDSKFNGCAAAKSGVKDGVDGLYESVTDPSAFTLIVENIVVDGVSYENLEELK